MILRDLNWRKGLFRLWLFLSAIWIVTISILGLFPATSRYIQNVKAARELKSLPTSINFDLDAARKAGKTDEQIANHLGQFHNFDVEGALKAGKTYSQIAEYLATHDRRSEKLRKLLESNEASKQDFLFNLAMTFFPPISLLICGVGLFWAVSGFVPVQKDRTP